MVLYKQSTRQGVVVKWTDILFSHRYLTKRARKQILSAEPELSSKFSKIFCSGDQSPFVTKRQLLQLEIP